MPNWCNNILTVVGEPQHVDALLAAVRGTPRPYAEDRETIFLVREKGERLLTFDRVLPVPDAVLGKGYSDAGYDWQTEHWGTKWDARDVVLERPRGGVAFFTFDTAWAPPTPVLVALAKAHPRVVLALSFGEEYPTRGRVLLSGGRLLEERVEQPPEGMDDDFDWGVWQRHYLDRHEDWVTALRAEAVGKGVL